MAVNIPIRWSTNTAELRAQLKEGLGQIVATEAGAKKLMDSLSGERMIIAAHKYAAAISEIGGVQKLTTAETTRANAVFDKAIEKYSKLGGALGPIPEDLKRIAAETKNVAEAEKNAATQAEKMAGAFRSMQNTWGASMTAMAKAAKDAEAQQTAAFKRTTEGLYGLSQGAKTVGMGMTAAITTPLLGMAAAGIAASAPFEASLQRMVSLAGVTSDELAGVKEHILALAPAVGIGPQKLAEGMMIVSSVVDDTAVALSILDVAAKGSAAGLGDTFDVARALTAVINSYGASNITAARAADIFVQTVKDGGAEAKELAPVLGNVVPIAAQLGVTFEEVGANIATVTKLGIPAAEAVTQLTSVFAGMLKETTKGKEAFKEIGMTYAQLRDEIKTKGLMQVLIELEEKFRGQPEMLAKIFGRIEALRNVMSTAGQQAETYATVLEHIKNAAGSLEGAFAAMKGTTVQTWNELKAQLDVIAIAFGDELAKALKPLMNDVKPLLDGVLALVKAFGALPDPVRETLIVLGGIVALLGPVIWGFGQLVGSIRIVMIAWAEVSAYLAGEAGIALVAEYTASFALFGETLIAIVSGPIGWTIGALALLGIALYETYQHSETVRAVFGAIADFIKSYVLTAWTDLKDIIESTGRIVRDLFILEWQHLKQEFHIDQILVLVQWFKDLGWVMSHDVVSGIKDILKQVPALRELLLGLELLGKLKAGAHNLADTLDEEASRQQGRLVGAHPIGPGMIPPVGLRSSMGSYTEDIKEAAAATVSLLEKVRALTATQRAQIEALKASGLASLQISEAMQPQVPKDVVAVYLRQLELAKQGTRGMNAELGTAAKYWTEYAQSVDQAAGDSLGAQLDKIERWHQTELAGLEKSRARNIEYWEDIAALEATYWQKRIAAEQAALKKQRDAVAAAQEKQLNDEYAQQVAALARDMAIFKEGEKANLAARKELNDVIAKSTMTAREQEERSIRDSAQAQIFALDQKAVDYRNSYDTIVETTRQKLQEIGILWDAETKKWVYTFDHMWAKGGTEHSMLPPDATFQTKKQVVTLSEILGGLGQTFTQLATIGQGSLGTVFKTLAGGTVAFKAFTDALKMTNDAMRALNVANDALEAAGAATGALSAATVTNLALAWVGVAIAVYQVADSLWKAHEAAVEAHAALVWATELANNFHNATQFSDELAASLRKAADSMKVDLATQGLFIMHGRDWMGRNEEQWHEALATALHIGEIVKELGGFAHLTTEQMNSVLGSMNDLFLVIEVGGAIAVDAIKELDDTLMDMAKDTMSRGGLVDKTFLDMAQHARELGVELEKVQGFQSEQAAAGGKGLVDALSVTNDAIKERAKLQAELADLESKGDSAETQAIAKIIDLKAKRDKAGRDTDKGRAYQDEIDTLIAKNQVLYDKTMAVRDAIEEQNKIIAITGVTMENVDAIAGGLLGSIAGQVEAGKSYAEAIRAIAPGIESLEAQLNAMGIGGGDTFDFLNAQVKLFTDSVTGPAMTAMEGYAAGLRGLNNAGRLNQDMFSGIASQITKTHDALIAQGVSGPQLLTAMQGPLQTLWELEQKFGYKADEATQALIDQAVANGEVGEKMKPIQEQMLDTMKEVAKAVNDLADALRGVPKAAKEASDSMKFGPIKVPVVFTADGSATTTGSGQPPATAATGGVVTTTGVRYLGSGGWVPMSRASFGNSLVAPKFFPMPPSFDAHLLARGTDTVPAMLTPGEGVVTTTGMRAIGEQGLASLNRGVGGGVDWAGEADDMFRAIKDLHYEQIGNDDTSMRPIRKDQPGGEGTEVHYHTWKIAITALDETDLRRKVEKDILPMMIDELEDNRRASARRMSDALRRSGG